MNQRLPSGPAVIEPSAAAVLGTGNSVIAPAGVMRPTWLLTASLNQRLPSGPATMPYGSLANGGTVNAVTAR